MGRLELADQGSLFLDEVGDIPIDINRSYCALLQEREFERLGSTRTKKVDVRLVAATNRDLEKHDKRTCEFRSDLYYRLNVFPIRTPPLRERLGGHSFACSVISRRSTVVADGEADRIRFPLDAMKKLFGSGYWPGNIRELENFIERSVILTRGRSLEVPVTELREVRTEEPGRKTTHPQHEEIAQIVKETIQALGGNANIAGHRAEKDRNAIVRALTETKGRVGGVSGAAARMGINRTTLLARMKKLGIDPKQYG